jgi:hypothetical protein
MHQVDTRDPPRKRTPQQAGCPHHGLTVGADDVRVANEAAEALIAGAFDELRGVDGDLAGLAACVVDQVEASIDRSSQIECVQWASEQVDARTVGRTQ